MQQIRSEESCYCPSFSSYAAGNLTDVARRVAGECVPIQEADEEFEFVGVDSSPNSEFGGVFPVFNRELLNDDASEEVRVPLEKLFIEDRDREASSSSSEEEDLEDLREGTYCVWSPKTPELSPGRCKKSNSTGSSASESVTKKWRLRDLLRRSKSDGKEAFLFLTPKIRREKDVERETKKEEKPRKTTVKKKMVVSAHEEFYVKKKEEEKRRRSYLPYRQDLVGLFANANASGRPFKPFA